MPALTVPELNITQDTVILWRDNSIMTKLHSFPLTTMNMHYGTIHLITFT